MGVVEIEILGRRYALRSDRPPEHLKAVAAFVDGKLRELAGGRPGSVQRDHAILAALNIASELFHLKRQRTQTARTVDDRLGDMVALIDEALLEDAEVGEASVDTQTLIR
ncbi:MAG: hypothetical protein CMP23_17165 [Rickettsiales bacterium]|nr:hypothetical protein [Rickettsiales bacterium]|tara:strand:- start:1834 stop:2163 length:330 start_codon:yes stop_codon:yes gene_type:complete